MFKAAAAAVAAALLSLFIATEPATAQLFETKAGQAFMVDVGTGTVLFSKDPDKLIPPASLAKLMTMEVVFHSIKEGKHTLADLFPISENAWRTGGAPSGTSTMFAQLKSQIALGDLIQGVVVQSANDGCIAIAEGMAGDEATFATQMTERARQIGLTQSVFKTATGLPAEGQVVTVRELVMLGMHIWREYPEFYKYYSQRDFTWNKITQRNRNPLLGMNIGADGMKTGFTEASGYAIVGSVSRDGRRVFAAMSGLKTEKERSEEARKLLEWGMTAFRQEPLYAADEIVGEAKVYGGEKSGVALKGKGPIAFLIPTANKERVSARIVYDGPLIAPVAAGTEVGVLRVFVGETLSQETPLFAAENVEVGPLHRRAFDAVAELLTGWLR